MPNRSPSCSGQDAPIIALKVRHFGAEKMLVVQRRKILYTDESEDMISLYRC
jgi:hypothetical protein